MNDEQIVKLTLKLTIVSVVLGFFYLMYGYLYTKHELVYYKEYVEYIHNYIGEDIVSDVFAETDEYQNAINYDKY